MKNETEKKSELDLWETELDLCKRMGKPLEPMRVITEIDEDEQRCEGAECKL